MERRTYPLRDGDLAAVHFGHTSNPLKLVFLHANGFDALAYRSVLEPLGVHAMAVDLRGHGRTALPAEPRRLKSWTTFRDDVLELFEHHIPRPVMLAGHSLGAVTGMLAARRLGARITGYVGMDPPLPPPVWRVMTFVPGHRALVRRAFPLARAAGKRRSVFPDRAAAWEHFHGRGAYRRFPDAVLRDFLEDGLLDSGEGVRLACAPAWESAIYTAWPRDAVRAVRHLPPFSRVVFAGINAPSTDGSRRAVARALGPDRVMRLDECGHLFPLERPEIATAILRDALQEVSLALPGMARPQRRTAEPRPRR